MERLAGVLTLLWALGSCSAGSGSAYSSWDADFARRPAAFDQAVTALWYWSYSEDPATGTFVRQTGWGQVPEKLDADGQGGYTAAVPVLLQTETSEGPQPDRFWTVLVHVVRSGDQFTLTSHDALPGEVVSKQDEGRRTVWLRGRTAASGDRRILWQFQGRF